MQNDDKTNKNNIYNQKIKDISLNELRILFNGLRHDISSPLMVLTGISYSLNNIAKSNNPIVTDDPRATNVQLIKDLSDRIHNTAYAIEAILDAFSKDIEASYRFPKVDNSLCSTRQLYQVLSKILDKYSDTQKAKIIWDRDISFEFKCNLLWLNKIITSILDSFFDNNPEEAKIHGYLNNKEKKLAIELKNFNKNIKIYNLEFCKKIMYALGGTLDIIQSDYKTNIQLTFLH
ncbi:MAG: hypothetical protein ACQPRH_00150 [Solitalea-like symbiont of Tyrophagus putrescentiae]